MKPNRKAIQVRQNRGSAVLEFAIIMPVLLLILFGVIEFGRAFSVKYALNGAAYEGARMAVLPGSTNSLVLNKINTALAGEGLTYSSYAFTPADIASAKAGDPVSVTVTVVYDSLTDMIPGLSGMSLRGVAVMRKEGFGT